MNLHVSVIVPAYNADKTILKCVTSILGQDFSESYEIIIIDNNSNDQTVNILKSIKDDKVRILSENKRGPSAARNRGIIAARGDYIAFTDADCEVEPDWLNRIMNTFKNKNVDAVGGGMCSHYKTIVSLAADISLFGEFTMHKKDIKYTRFVPTNNICYKKNIKYTRFVPTNNICYKKNIFEEYGLFNENFKFAGGEDALFNWKLFKNNVKICYNSEILIIHHHKSKLTDFLRKKIEYGRGFYISRILDKSMPHSLLIKSFLYIPLIFSGKMIRDTFFIFKNGKILYKLPLLLPIIAFGNICFCVGIIKERYFGDQIEDTIQILDN